jgi:hypothetical protein
VNSVVIKSRIVTNESLYPERTVISGVIRIVVVYAIFGSVMYICKLRTGARFTKVKMSRTGVSILCS